MAGPISAQSSVPVDNPTITRSRLVLPDSSVKNLLDTTGLLLDASGNPIDAEHPIYSVPGVDPEGIAPSYHDSGNINANSNVTFSYPAVAVNKYWQILRADMWAGVIYKVEFIIDGVIVANGGNLAGTPCNLEWHHLLVTAGQILSIKYYNRNPSLGGAAGSVYSTIQYIERST